MALIDVSRLKERLVKALSPWFLGREQDALIEAMKTAGEETLLAVDVDTAALQAQLTNLYSNAGADAIGIADAGSFYTGTSVEDALQEIGPLIGAPDAVTSVFGRLGAVIAQAGDYTKADVGLSNVDNTSDLNKPVSTAQQTALNLKANLASPTFTGTVGGITKSMVGLSNVDNTSDVNKPVSTAQLTALNLKADLTNPSFTGDVTASGNFIANGAQFYGSNTVAILRTAASGVVYLRPNGGSPGQTTVDSAGDMVVSGNISAANISDVAGNSTIVKRTSAGYINVNYLNTTSNVTGVLPTNVWVETGSDSYIRKQTLSDLVDHMISNTAVGARAVTHRQNSAANFTLTQGHAGGSIVCTAAITITLPTTGIGTREVFTIFNRTSGNVTVSGAGTTIRLAGTSSTGTRTIGPWGLATIICYGGAEWWVSGAGVT